MKTNYTNERISVDEAAKMLSMNKQTVRVLMQRGELPIGVVYKSEKAEKNNTYYIYKNRVVAYIKGLDLTGNH